LVFEDYDSGECSLQTLLEFVELLGVLFLEVPGAPTVGDAMLAALYAHGNDIFHLIGYCSINHFGFY
jgi:hypothetical protein